MARDKRLFEDIIDRITAMFVSGSREEQPSDMDSSIEVRGGSTATTGDGGYSWYKEQTDLDSTRFAQYKDFDLMDKEDPVLSSALDVYADNVTRGTSDEDTVIEIICEEERIVELLDQVIRRTKLDNELWSIARTLAKFGDDFEEIVVYDDLEVHRLKHLPVNEMYVVTDDYGRLDNEYPYKQKSDMDAEIKFKDWQILHFKLKRRRDSDYGVDGSVFAASRKTYKQLAMMEDALVIARLTRAQQRYGFLIDVDGIEPGQPTLDYLNKVRDSLKKRRTIDPRTGKMDMQYNPLSMEEDLFLGRRKDGGSDVKVLQGAGNLGQLEDIEYFRNKVFAGIKVPKAYLGFERDVNAKATLTEQDVQFARSVRRVQLAIVGELRKLFDFVLYTNKIDAAAVDYTVKMPVISTLDEIRIWTVEKMKAEIADTLVNKVGVSTKWILKNMLDMTDEDIDEILADLDAEQAKEIELMTRTVGLPADEPEPVEEPAEESITKTEINMLKFRLREEIETLKEFNEWKNG